MAYSREELLTEAKRRGLAVPPDLKQNDFSKEEVRAEALRRGLAVPPDLKQNDFSKEEVRAEALRRGLIKPHEESYLRSALTGALKTSSEPAAWAIEHLGAPEWAQDIRDYWNKAYAQSKEANPLTATTGRIGQEIPNFFAANKALGLGLGAAGKALAPVVEAIPGASKTKDILTGLFSTKKAANKVIQEADTVKSQFNKGYNEFFEDALESGAEIEKTKLYGKKELSKVAKTWKYNSIRRYMKYPTIKNAHKAQSDIGKLVNQLEKIPNRTSEQNSVIRNALKNKDLIQDSIHNALGKGSELSNRYRQLGEGYATEVGPYLNPKIDKLMKSYKKGELLPEDFAKAMGRSPYAKAKILPENTALEWNLKRQGFKKGIAPAALKTYVFWELLNHLF